MMQQNARWQIGCSFKWILKGFQFKLQKFVKNIEKRISAYLFIENVANIRMKKS